MNNRILKKIDNQDVKAWKQEKVTEYLIAYLEEHKEYLEAALHSQDIMLEKDGVKRYCIHLGGLEVVNTLLNLDFEMLEHLGENDDDRHQ
jgi:hypothetical protein